jgi:hypothetical protein
MGIAQAYQQSSPPAWNTSGMGNVWDANGVVLQGTPVTTIYQAVAGTPYAAEHPASNLCAASIQGTDTTWYYWSVSSTLADRVGIDDEVIVNGRTECEYPFDLGDLFTDTYTLFGSTSTFTMEYAATGSIQTPFGTIDDVVMFSYNSGSSYELYRAGNVLRRIGTYVPGVQLEVSDVQVYVGVDEHALQTLTLAPVPARDRVTVELPWNHEVDVLLIDLLGHPVRQWTSVGGSARLDLDGIGDGNYLLLARAYGVNQAVERLVVAR